MSNVLLYVGCRIELEFTSVGLITSRLSFVPWIGRSSFVWPWFLGSINGVFWRPLAI
jgi:hypothetical protein